MKSKLNFLYDQGADVLYVSKGHPVYSDYVELNDDIILRLDPATQEVVGFTIVDFVGRFTKQGLPLSVPLNVTFDRAPRRTRARVAAETKPFYRTKRATVKR